MVQEQLDSFRRESFSHQSWGTLWGVGVGPGHPEWLTLQGLKIVQTVPVIACPQNAHRQPGMAYDIIRSYLHPSQQIVPLELPFVRDEQQLKWAWKRAIAQLESFLEKGQDVAFIAEGDISFYSTFTYISQTLQEHESAIKIQSIPGICSPLAAAAVLGQPLGIGDEKIAILPAIYHIHEIEKVLDWADVVILMKVGSVFSDVWQLLNTKGLLDQASLVEWVGWLEREDLAPMENGDSCLPKHAQSQRKQTIFSTLCGLSDYRPPYFSVLIIRQSLNTRLYPVCIKN